MSVVAELLAGVQEDANMDVKEAQALRWLTGRQRQMCAVAGCYRKTLDLGPVVAGQSTYALDPGIVEILQVTVGELVYGDARHADYAMGERGWLWLTGEGGIAGREDSAAGAQELRLFPVPSEGSEPTPGEAHLSLYCKVEAPAIVVGDDSTVVIPSDYYDALVSGAIATGMLRDETLAGLAQPHEQIFQAEVHRLLIATNRKFRGAGPARVRLLVGRGY